MSEQIENSLQVHKLIETRANIDEKVMLHYLQKFSGEVYSSALDIACGLGVTTRMLKKCFHIERLFGIDIEDELIDYAKKNYDKGIEYMVGDAMNLPFEDCAFDLTFSRMLFEVCPQIEKILDEIIRVTNKGGRIVFWGNLETTPQIYPHPLYYNKYIESERKILRATRKLQYNPLQLYSLLKRKKLKEIEFVPVVKDINNFNREELIKYYFEEFDIEIGRASCRERV